MTIEERVERLKDLHLPEGEYLLVSSAALAIRGIREARDLDVAVSESLWEKLAQEYPPTTHDGVNCIDLGQDDIEILDPHTSWYGHKGPIPLAELFEKGDTFLGVKFINLDHLETVKRSMGREKDLRDIELIHQYRNQDNRA